VPRGVSLETSIAVLPVLAPSRMPLIALARGACAGVSISINTRLRRCVARLPSPRGGLKMASAGVSAALLGFRAARPTAWHPCSSQVRAWGRRQSRSNWCCLQPAMLKTTAAELCWRTSQEQRAEVVLRRPTRSFRRREAETAWSLEPQPAGCPEPPGKPGGWTGCDCSGSTDRAN